MSIETRQSWVVAGAALLVLTAGFGAPLISTVALKPIAASLGAPRSVPALANAAAYLGSGVGGILMGVVSQRLGLRRVAVFGLCMIALGMAIASHGSEWALILGHGLFVGFLGLACLFAPFLTLVSRWFDRRRGTAVALVSSGQYLAGIVWPTPIEWVIDRFGWQAAMFGYAIGMLALLPLITLLRPAPPATAANQAAGPQPGRAVLGLPPNLAAGLIALAIFLCCVSMAMPQGHMVALCSDAGMTPGRGAAMLSWTLGLAFFSRQFWGWLADRAGGMPTVLAASTVQAVAVAIFAATQDPAGLVAAATLFGLGFSGIVPAYVVALRELFPDREASFRVPVLLLAGQAGMAVGGWLAGAIYDGAIYTASGSYAPAFLTGLGFNLANLLLLGVLMGRGAGPGWRVRPPTLSGA